MTLCWLVGRVCFTQCRQHSTPPRSSVCWLVLPPGAGKSAVCVQSVCVLSLPTSTPHPTARQFVLPRGAGMNAMCVQCSQCVCVCSCYLPTLDPDSTVTVTVGCRKRGGVTASKITLSLGKPFRTPSTELHRSYSQPMHSRTGVTYT